MGLYWPNFSLVFLIHLFLYAGVYCRADFVCLSSDCTVLIRKGPQVIPGGGSASAPPSLPGPPPFWSTLSKVEDLKQVPGVLKVDSTIH